jgi:hypothetical protein
MSQYFDADPAHPEYEALANALFSEETTLPKTQDIASVHTDEQLTWLLDVAVQTDIMKLFADTARSLRFPIKAIAWRKAEKRRLVFQLNHFDRLLDAYLARKLTWVKTTCRHQQRDTQYFIKLDI